MINVNIFCTSRKWILNKLGRKILEYCPEDINIRFNRYDFKIEKNDINYYVAYQKFKEKTCAIDVGFFTHPNNSSFIKKAKIVDYCIVMCSKYKKYLINCGISEKNISIIYPYVDYKYKPRIKILQPVIMSDEKRKYRKGKELWDRIKNIEYVDCLCTEGIYSEDELLNLYRNCDIVLSTSVLEGGPMCVIEGLALGKTVVAPRNVGFIDDFNGIIKYDISNFEQVKKILDDIYNEKLKISKNVEELTEKNWANSHYDLFRKLALKNLR